MKYTVCFSGTYAYCVEVDADNKDRAVEKAQEKVDEMTVEAFNKIVAYQPRYTDVWDKKE